jgi:hypothetical protein
MFWQNKKKVSFNSLVKELLKNEKLLKMRNLEQFSSGVRP